MFTTNYTIRDAHSLDIDTLVLLLTDLFTIEDNFTIDQKKQRHGLVALLNDCVRSSIKVAECEGNVIGMCTAQINISTAEGGYSVLVEDLIVKSTFRNKGIGTALLDSVFEWALTKGCKRVQLLADKRNEKALTFYDHKGFQLTDMICLSHKMSHWNCSSFSSSNNNPEINTRR